MLGGQALLPKSLVCSDRSAFTCLSRHCPQCFHISYPSVIETTATLGALLRAVTVWLWHHNFMEVPTALIRVLILNTGCKHFSMEGAFQYFHCVPVDPWAALWSTEIWKYIFLQYGSFNIVFISVADCVYSAKLGTILCRSDSIWNNVFRFRCWLLPDNCDSRWHWPLSPCTVTVCAICIACGPRNDHSSPTCEVEGAASLSSSRTGTALLWTGELFKDKQAGRTSRPCVPDKTFLTSRQM